MIDTAADIAWEECLPDLPLDDTHLPPLNALSPTSPDSLPSLDVLDLFSLDESPTDDTCTFSAKPRHDDPFSPDMHLHHHALSTEKLSSCTSTPSDSSATDPRPALSAASSPRHTVASSPPPPIHLSSPQKDLAPQQDIVQELSTRLHAAGAETSALRKRVAQLTAENRGLRASLDHANARLAAVAQAAAAHPPPSTSPIMVGLAQVSADVAQRLAAAMSLSDNNPDDPRVGKKRRRVTGAATTMACVMFMWGAMVGTPGMLKSGATSYRSDGNLPAIWNSKEQTSTAVAPAMPRVVDPANSPWQPNCMRVLQQLPTGSETTEDGEEMKDVASSAKAEDAETKVKVKAEPAAVESPAQDTAKKEAVVVHDPPTHGDALFVDMQDEEAAHVVARSDMRAAQMPEYSYVLCRDAAAAIDNVKACASRMQRGEKCGQPHTISLILPAAAAGMVEQDSELVDGMPALAEVQCSITSVARIPAHAATVSKPKSTYGRIIATVAEGQKADVRQTT